MNRLPQAQLYDYVFAHVVPTDSAATHLADCDACRQTIDALALLTQELAVARRSQPTQVQLARYTALYAQGESVER